MNRMPLLTLVVGACLSTVLSGCNVKPDIQMNKNTYETNDLSESNYNSYGEIAPGVGPTAIPMDFNGDGKYKSFDDMTKEEIETEFEEMQR